MRNLSKSFLEIFERRMLSTNMQTFVRGMQMYSMRIMRSNDPQFDRKFHSS